VAHPLASHWQEVLDALYDGVVVVGRDGKIMWANHALTRLTGYQRQELLERPCSTLNCDACEVARRRGGSFWCNLFAGSQPEGASLPCRLVRKDGSYLQVLKTANLLRDERGRVVAAVESLTDLSELERRERKIQELSSQLAGASGLGDMLGESRAMQRVFKLIAKAAQSDVPVIIYGESGTGKELAARAVHQLGPRREGPFVIFNCAAMSEQLFESELFGHVKGAFTGAHRHRPGRLEVANGGDFFIDEIGELTPACQVKLLRVLETKVFERVGDHRPLSVDVRFIAATNRNLEQMVARQEFREDLFFRINVIPIHLPPLRERREDIPLLAASFLAQLRRKNGKEISGLSPETLRRFLDYPWPGNVRELRTCLEYAFVVAEKGRIQPSHLPPQFSHPAPCHPQHDQAPAAALGGDRAKQELIEALRRTGGNKSQAARLLGVSRATVFNRMRKYGIQLNKVICSQQ